MNKIITFNIFSHFYIPHIGGVERYTANLATQLVKKGHSVNVITTNHNNLGFKSTVDGINIYRLSSVILINKNFPIPYNPYELFRVIIECYSRKYRNVTIANTRIYLTTLLGLIISNFFGKTKHKIVIEHGSDFRKYGGRSKQLIIRMYEYTITFILKLLKPRFYAVSERSSNWLNTFGISSEGVLYNGVDLPEFENNQKDSVKQLLFVGRIIKAKGVFQLLDGFTKFQTLKDSGNYKLLFIGDGEDILELKKQVSVNNIQNVEIIGNLPYHETLRYISNSYALICPSIEAEGLPTVILEAGFYNVPIITSTTGGVTELLRDKESDILLKSVSADTIYKSLTELSNNYNYYKKKSTHLSHYIRTNFVWDKLIDTFLGSILNDEDIDQGSR